MKKIVDAIIAAVIAVVIIGSVLMVAIDDNVILRKNNDYGSVAEYTDVDWTAEFTVTDSGVSWVVDGVEQSSYEMDKDGRVYLVIADSTYFYYDLVSGSVPSSVGISYINDEGKAFTALGIVSCTISASNGTITYTPILVDTAVDPIVKSYDWVFVAKDVGDYRTLNLANYGSASLVFNNIDQIYGVNYVSTTGNVWFSFNGDRVKYGLEDVTMDITMEQIGENVYRSVVKTSGSDWQFVVDNGGEDYSVSPFVWIVPYEVSGTALGIPSSVENIIGAIPVIVIVAVLLAIIAAFFRTRY